MYPSNNQSQPQSFDQYGMQAAPHQVYNVGPNAYGAPLLETQRNISAKIQSIDDKLEHGGYRCFYIWMYVSLFFGVLSVIGGFFNSFEQSRDKTSIILSAISSIWFLLQFVFQILAFREKSLGKATIAMILFMINCLLLFASTSLIALAYHFLINNPTTDSKEDYEWAKSLLLASLIFISMQLIFQLFVNLLGSIKVRKLLKARRRLEEKLQQERISY